MDTSTGGIYIFRSLVGYVSCGHKQKPSASASKGPSAAQIAGRCVACALPLHNKSADSWDSRPELPLGLSERPGTGDDQPLGGSAPGRRLEEAEQGRGAGDQGGRAYAVTYLAKRIHIDEHWQGAPVRRPPRGSRWILGF